MRHNNQLPNQHFRKDWQIRVRTWFNQPARKVRRRLNRVEKAAKIAPRPVDGFLRPAVRAQTLNYNSKIRAGKGFTLEELKEAGVNRNEARFIGIAVDHRRKNRSEESLQLNAQRLKEYMSKLIVFPKKAEAVQLPAGALLPIANASPREKARKSITKDKKTAYYTLRKAQSDAWLVGIRAKRAKELAEKEAEKKK
jgi:large subunit ribosomal protein L13e